MSERYDYWVHGADVNIEYPDRVQGNPRRAGWGTTVTQGGGSDNWFHFAIPTPTVAHDEDEGLRSDRTDQTVEVYEMWLTAETNENARVDRLHAWDGDSRFKTRDGITGLENQQFQERLNVNHNTAYGLNLSVHVQCLDSENPMPEVTFNGAGAHFSVE